MESTNRRRPNEIRDAVIATLQCYPSGAGISEIVAGVQRIMGDGVPESSVRSYLFTNTPRLFVQQCPGRYILSVLANKTNAEPEDECYTTAIHGKARLVHADCFEWLGQRDPASIHAVVTDPPYGLVEYSDQDQTKLREGKGGNWRLPPSFDGVKRSPLPRFTVLSSSARASLGDFFSQWAAMLAPALVPGANVVVATNPLLSYIVAGALAEAGLERRGEIVRLVTTMRGGDRPKGAHSEFDGVSVMPRSMWEPWLIFRKPLEGRVQDNLRKWRTGGFRRPSERSPFGDVIRAAPARRSERTLAAHPNLKPQRFLRILVRGVLPLGEGVVLDPFCGSGSTLAAANWVGYKSIGIEKDERYFDLANTAIPRLTLYCPTAKR